MNRAEYMAHDAVGLAGAIRRGDTTASEALGLALTLLDQAEPELNALPVDLREIGRARAADAPDGPLGGVPFLLKNLGADWAGVPETAGSQLLQDNVGAFTRTFVQRYLNAGLVVFGRTASPEFGISYLTEPAIYGPTRNPWDISRSPGGSSGGAAALVAAGVLPAAQASDGGGSIRIPAACCGLVGLKLTRSRVPTGPKLGESWAGLAGAHVITRSVRDTAAFLDIAKGYDEGQPNHPENAHLIFADTVSRLDRPLRIGVSEYARRLTPTDPEVSGCLMATVERLSEMGHAVSEVSPGHSLEETEYVLWALVSANLATGVADIRRALRREGSLEDGLEPATAACIRMSDGWTAQDYIRLLVRRDQLARAYVTVFRDVDVLLTPVMPGPAPRIGALTFRGPGFEDYRHEMFRQMPYTPIQNISGTPAISLPLGMTEAGLPIGLMFSTAYGREDILLGLAGQLESAMGGFNRVAPLLIRA